MERLPEEVLLHVLGFLDEAADLSRACRVNRSWHTLASDDSLWRELGHSNGWTLPADVVAATRDLAAKLMRSSHKREAPLEDHSLPTHSVLSFLSSNLSTSGPGNDVGAKATNKQPTKRKVDKLEASSKKSGKRAIGGVEGGSEGVWKNWYVLALVERVLDGKTEREVIVADPDEKKAKRKRKQRRNGARRSDGDDDENEDEDQGEIEAEDPSSDKCGEEEEEEEEEPLYTTKRAVPSRQVILSRSPTDGEEETEELHGGTVWGILNFLLTEDTPNNEKGILAFIVTHTVFADSGHVLDLLINFFEGGAHANASRTFQGLWAKYKGRWTQAKVLYMLERWLARYPRAFIRPSAFTPDASASPDSMRDRLARFLDRAAGSGPRFAQELTALRDRLEVLEADVADGRQQSEQDDDEEEDEPSPCEMSEEEMFKRYQALEIVKIKTDVLARQLALMDYELFQRLTHEELLEQRWKRQPKRCRNVRRLVRHFNHVSGVVTTSIVLEKSDKARAKMIKKWVEVAHKCLEFNNINCTLDIISGIGSSPVFRLNRTWSRLSKSVQKRLEGLQEVLSRRHSYKRLRELLFSAVPPCIPYLGMYLVDLAFINDGNPHTIEVGWPDHREVLCWPYHYMTANAINHLLSFQGHPFPFAKDEELSRKLLCLEYLSSERCYQLSLSREPREPGKATTSAPLFEAW